MANSQELELSGGIAHKQLFGAQRRNHEPVFGVELSAARLEQTPFSADRIAWGANLGIFRRNSDSEAGPGQFQQLVETTATFRYEVYCSDVLTFYYGASAGFSFASLQSNQQMLASVHTRTQLYTRGMLSPNAGLTVEFNKYLALYYRFQYDLGRYFGAQPTWETTAPKWNHGIAHGLGARMRFW